MAWNNALLEVDYDAAIALKDSSMLVMKTCHTDCVNAMAPPRDADTLKIAQLTMKAACQIACDQSKIAHELMREDGITPENTDEYDDERDWTKKLSMSLAAFKAIS